MIPSDVATRLQVSADAALRPVANIQEITDRLAGLVPGQRLMAEIQALMPNGTYRALINQRDVTLALPFSAKAGDTLELEVTSTEGKLTLAVLSRPPGDTSQAPTESVPTTLSRTGQLIGSLFGNTDEAKSGPTPTALNGNQPIASSPPMSAQDILPQLKQAITQSGMFYESHQADWVDGRLSRNALLQEPQGQLPPRFSPMTSGPAEFAQTTPGTGQPAQGDFSTAPRMADGSPPALQRELPSALKGEQADMSRRLLDSNNSQITGASAQADKVVASQSPAAQLVAAPALPLVQQQLEALATQNFVWQGQAWPGQTMRWEIEEDAQHGKADDDDTASRWQTRLHLTLPNLGEVNAQIRLQGSGITLALTAGNNDTQALLRSATEMLRSQLGEAGLSLSSVGVSNATEAPENGQAQI